MTTAKAKATVQVKTLSSTYDYDTLIKEMVTKSAMIRRLNAEGYKRMDISKFMNIRYQHVRNVLVQEAEKAELKALREAK